MVDRLFVAPDKRVVGVLLELCEAASNNHRSLRLVPEYLKVVRARMVKFLFNALAYNVNYKDLSHTNVEHMTNFFMYPAEMPHRPIYPFCEKLFANTLLVNGGYLNHCDCIIVDAGISNSPFVTRRDFNLTLLYLVLTGKVRLTVTVCRSYLFKGSYNPLEEVFKGLVMALKMTQALPARMHTARWVVKNDGRWFMAASLPGLTKRTIKIGLRYCGDNVLFWTPEKMAAIDEFASSTNLRVKTEKMPTETLLTETRGMYLVSATCGLVVNVRDCHPYVYVWTQDGLYRFDCLVDYLYSGLSINHTVRRLIP